jgi:hypothetical protein
MGKQLVMETNKYKPGKMLITGRGTAPRNESETDNQRIIEHSAI